MCCGSPTVCSSNACARWRRAIRSVEYEERIIDAMAALLVRDAGAFDVIVTTNMFGDILSDEASEIAGSLGLAASLNAGDDHAVAQAQHGSAPDIAGQGPRQPGLADRLGRDAARLARRTPRRRAPHAGRRGDRGGDRPRRSPTRSRAPPISAARSAPRLSVRGWRRWWTRAGRRSRSSEDRGSAYRNHAKPGWSRAATRADR